MNRRKFIKASSLTAGVYAFAPALANRRFQNPLSTINIGVIGCNGMGWSNVQSILNQPNVDLVAICDVDKNVVDRRLTDFKKIRPSQQKPSTYTDYTDLLNHSSVDAVIIGTPDHWHCKITCDALAAGKHVYVEKPLANSIEECKVMVAAQKKYGKKVQVGQWQRSGDQYQQAYNIVHSGRLGNIRQVKCWSYQGWMEPIEPKPDTTPPKGVDYQSWLGPAPNRPFNPNRFHFEFRWFWDYAGGLMTDWGVHELDIALHIMGVSAPNSIMASGGKLAYPNDASETPDTLQAIYNYDEFNLIWEHATGIQTGPYGLSEGIAFVGNNGTLIVNRRGYELIPEHDWDGWATKGPAKTEQIPMTSPEQDTSSLNLHMKNFLQSIRTDDESILTANNEQGAISAINAHMGNIAYRTGEKLSWNKEKESFDEKQANKYLKPAYQNGIEFPVI